MAGERRFEFTEAQLREALKLPLGRVRLGLPVGGGDDTDTRLVAYIEAPPKPKTSWVQRKTDQSAPGWADSGRAAMESAIRETVEKCASIAEAGRHILSAQDVADRIRALLEPSEDSEP